MAPKDARDSTRIANYSSKWDKDSSLDSKTHTENRLEEYKDVVNDYDGATELYEYGWGQSFHFCRFFKGEAFYAGLARHEHYLSAQINIRPGMKVLDVGCGVAGPARAIARFSDANITGISLNQFQVDKANAYIKKEKLQDQVHAVQGDFMKLDEKFAEGSFDAVYAIEATVHAPTFEGIYSQIFHVLKPGGVAGIYEWVMTDKYDPTNPEHKKIAHGIEIGDGIAEMRTRKQAHDAFISAGFEILVEDDLADRGDEVDWFYPLEGDFSKAQTLYDYATVFRTSKLGQFITHNAMWAMEKVGMIPKGTHDVGETLRIAGDALVAGGQQKLFTPMQLYIVRKPL